MSEFGRSEYGERLDYIHNKFQDIIFAILFYLHVAGVAIGIGWLYAVEIPKMNSNLPRDQQINVGEKLTGIWITIPVCSLSGLCIGLIWLQVIKAFPNDIIKAVYICSIIAWTVLFIIGLFVLNIGMIIVGAAMAVFTALYVWYIWQLIPFSSVLLAMATKVVNIYGDVVWISILGIVFQICWLFLWGALCGGYLYTFWNIDDDDPNGGLLFLMLLSLYWGLLVFNNIVRVSACGVAATWYFSASVTQKPTTPSLRSTLGTSFGSICLGSIFTSILEGLRVTVTTLARDSNRISGCSCCCNIMIHLVNGMIRYSNTYSWAHIAIYGKRFIVSSKQTWKLFQHSGIIKIINDDLTGTTTLNGGIVGGLVNASIGYGLGWIFYKDIENEKIKHFFPAALAIYGGISGLMLTMCILTIIRGAVVTIFLCYAEDGLLMEENRPLYYNKLIKADPRLIHVTKHVASGVPLTETKSLAETK